jgi:hypothetical protein
MENFNLEIVGGILLGTLLFGFITSKYFKIYRQELQYAENSFKDAEFIQSLNLISDKAKNIYKKLSKMTIPKYLMALDPIKYYYLKKEFNLLNKKSSKKLEEMSSD